MVGMKLIREREVYAYFYIAQIIEKLEKDDAEWDRPLVSLGYGKQLEVVEYNAQMEKQDIDDKLYVFKKMQDIGFICKMDPKPRNLLERVASLTLWVEKYAQIMSYRMFLFVSVSRPMFEIRRWTEWWNKQNPIFGALHQSTNLEFELSYNWNDSDLLDKENKNSLWKEAINTELTELNDYEAFEKNGRGAKLPNSYQNIRVWCETWSQKKSMTCRWLRYDRSTKRQYLFKRGMFDKDENGYVTCLVEWSWTMYC
jgi:hypothetical protein